MKINKNTDFSIAFTLEKEPDDFRINLRIGRTSGVLFSKGQCKKKNDNYLLYVDSKSCHFGVGKLECTIYSVYADENYPDGYKNVATPYDLDIELIDGPSDDDDLDPKSIAVLSHFYKGDPGSAISDETKQEIIDGVSKLVEVPTKVSELENDSHLCECAKVTNKATVIWRYKGQSLIFNTDVAITLLSTLEMYANKCYVQTDIHRCNIESLETVEEIIAYDFTTGYPSKLNLTNEEVQNG